MFKNLKSNRNRGFRKGNLSSAQKLCFWSLATAIYCPSLINVMNYPPINQNLDIQSFMKMNPNNKCPENKKGEPDNAPEICSQLLSC